MLYQLSYRRNVKLAENAKINLPTLPQFYLKRQIESEEARAGEHERHRHGEQQNVIIDAVGEKEPGFGLEAELDDENDDVQKSRNLRKETDNEKN